MSGFDCTHFCECLTVLVFNLIIDNYQGIFVDMEDHSSGVVPNDGIWVSCGVVEKPKYFVIRFGGGFFLLGV